MGWGGRLLTFSAFRMGAYSRWALIRGWALIRINTVPLLQFKPEKLIFHYSNFPASLMLLWAFDIGQEPYSFKLLTNLYDQNSLETLLVGPR